MCKILDQAALQIYAEKAAHKLGIKIPNMKRVLKQMNMVIPQPTLIENGIYQLWIDKYYIAYSRYDDENVNYVYLTKEHIHEEYDSYKKARRYRKNKVYVPPKIKAIFASALCKMRAADTDYYLDKSFFEIG